MFKPTVVALAVLCLGSMAMAQLVANDDNDQMVRMRHNASHDNLYRPGNAIWRLRMLRMGLIPAINDVNAPLDSRMDLIGTESSAVVSDPLAIYGTQDIVSVESAS